jgi:hypothetical protein
VTGNHQDVHQRAQAANVFPQAVQIARIDRDAVPRQDSRHAWSGCRGDLVIFQVPLRRILQEPELDALPFHDCRLVR